MVDFESLVSLFGWFSDKTFLIYLLLFAGGFIFLWRRGSEWATGRRPALLFYGLAFFVVLDYAQTIGNAVNAPIPVTAILLLLYGLEYYRIWKGG